MSANAAIPGTVREAAAGDPELRKTIKSEVQAAIEAFRDQAVGLSHRIHGTPELGFEEFYSSREVANELRAAGFTVTERAFGLDTAISAVAGEGSFKAVVVAEYDALPDLGHACGHNMIAACAVAAAVGLKHVAGQLDLTVELLGTPAEETGGGKILMLEQGAFIGSDMAMMIHPAPFEDASPSFLASAGFSFTFSGRSSHAAASPWEAANAADASTIAQVAIGLLRQQLPNDTRVHGVVTNAGAAANVIPGKSGGLYGIRAQTLADLEALIPRVEACFTGAALAAGCTVELDWEQTYPNVVQSPRLASLYQRNAETLGRSFPQDAEARAFRASTDFGAVSQVVPSLHPHIKICDTPVSNHQYAFTEAASSDRADHALIEGAIAMAWTVVDAALTRICP
ncbi:amidohydrolase [Arthrobacter sp. M-10]|uniref:amidohydrolase n=1 Tax=Arthrobacter sp. M-10 TaxID=3233037 RepID=UPI003F92A111